jgi:hypothetical protein
MELFGGGLDLQFELLVLLDRVALRPLEDGERLPAGVLVLLLGSLPGRVIPRGDLAANLFELLLGRLALGLGFFEDAFAHALIPDLDRLALRLIGGRHLLDRLLIGPLLGLFAHEVGSFCLVFGASPFGRKLLQSPEGGDFLFGQRRFWHGEQIRGSGANANASRVPLPGSVRVGEFTSSRV